MLVVIRGGGDIATGIALRLHRAGMEVVICETACPTAIRRTVCFSEAVRLGEAVVEGVTARRADLEEVPDILAQGVIPVLVDPTGACIDPLVSDAVVDAILAKRNLGTTIDMAPVVVAAGPGFTAGVDCHAVVETMRGHYLGRVVSCEPRRTASFRVSEGSANRSGRGTQPGTWTASPCGVLPAARCGASWPTACR